MNLSILWRQSEIWLIINLNRKIHYGWARLFGNSAKNTGNRILLEDENSISYCGVLECGAGASVFSWAGSALYIVLLFSFPRQRDFSLGKIHNPNLLYPQYNTWKKKLFINLCWPPKIHGFKSSLPFLSGHMRALYRRRSRSALFSNDPVGCFQVTVADWLLDWISERFV